MRLCKVIMINKKRIIGILIIIVLGAITYSIVQLYLAAIFATTISDVYQLQRNMLDEIAEDFEHIQDGNLSAEQYFRKVHEKCRIYGSYNSNYPKIERDFIFEIHKKDSTVKFTVTRKKDKRIVLKEAWEIIPLDTQPSQTHTRKKAKRLILEGEAWEIIRPDTQPSQTHK